MATETQLGDPGRLYPVCCATEVTPEVMDRFIEANQMYRDQLLCNFVFVDSVSETYTEESEIGMDTPSSAASPFKNKNPEECHQLLRQLCLQTASDIDYTLFVIMDDRSVVDDSVLLVSTPWEGETGEIRTVRVAFEVAHFQMLGYGIAEGDIEQDIATAQEAEDGILRADALRARVPR